MPAITAPPPTQKKARRTEEKSGVAFWDLKAEAKSKGKQLHANGQDVAPSPVGLPRKGKGKQPVVEIIVPRLPVRRAKSPVPSPQSDHGPEAASTSHASANGLAPPPPRKKRRLTHHASAVDLAGRSSTRQSLRSAASVPDLYAAASDDSHDAASSGAVNGASSMGPPAEPPPSPTKPTIPRIKLIVRKPAPVYTHPLQRPKATPFGGSIETLLNSFTFRLHGEVTAEQLDEEVEAELKVWRHVDKLRKEGRMVGERSSFEYKPADANDAWGHIVREIERPGAKLVNTRRGAANVAGKVKGHWTGESDRERKRLRVLARTALEMVIEEWKKAVYVSNIHDLC